MTEESRRHDVIILQCVRQGSKLRIRFEAYIDQLGVRHNGVYNNRLNCQFPRDIRAEGRHYQIPAEDLELSSRGFYRVMRRQNIQILSEDQSALETEASAAISSASSDGKKKKKTKVAKKETVVKQFEALAECCICLDTAPDRVFVPCGHACCCSVCYSNLTKVICPLCRRAIQSTLNID